MTKNLKTADAIVKLVLSILIVVTYFTNVISGPMAKVLLFLALLILIIFAVRWIIRGPIVHQRGKSRKVRHP